MEIYTFDAVVIGAGAGGFGAAYQLAQNGLHIAIVDKNPGFGGTAVFAGVSCWEPGVSCHPVLSELTEIISQIPQAGGVGFSVPNSNLFAMAQYPQLDEDWRHHDFAKIPSGVSAVKPDVDYERSCSRCRRIHGNGGRYHFEGGAMTQAMEEMLHPYAEKVTTFWNAEFLDCSVSHEQILSVRIQTAEGPVCLQAKEFIDSSGDIVLARAAGCQYIMGAESQETYQEPSAGERDPLAVNGVTRVFRISRSTQSNPAIGSDIASPDISEWKEHVLYPNKVVACYNIYPNGDINVNMLPTMDGDEYFRLGKEADRICTARAVAYFDYVQNHLGALQEYHLQEIFPMMGIRESYRLVGQTVLTEQDVRTGFLEQQHRDEIIAYSDHAMDVHGKNHLLGELEIPYGVPYSCLLPKEISNLHVACRGASFSRIAASSCRLTRVMIALGLAAGEAVSQRILNGSVDVCTIREKFGFDKYESLLLEKINSKF